MSRLAANSILLLTALLWGCAFVAQSTAMAKLGPIAFTALRFLIAAATVLPFAILEGRGGLLPRPDPGSRPRHAAWIAPAIWLAIVFLLGQLTQQFGMLATTVTNAGFLTALYVILVPIFGIVLFRQWPHAVVWPAALVALGGTWLLGGGFDGLRSGDFLVMASAVFWALQVVLIGRVIDLTGRPLFAVFAQSAIGGAAALLLAVTLEPISLSAATAAIPELFVTGVLSGGLAFSLQAIGQRYTSAADAAVVFSAEAVFAALAAAVMLGERLSLMGVVGCALILGAILAVQLVPLLSRRGSRSAGRQA